MFILKIIVIELTPVLRSSRKLIFNIQKEITTKNLTENTISICWELLLTTLITKIVQVKSNEFNMDIVF